MRAHFMQAGLAVIPVFAATLAIATLFTADLPFPAPLERSAWPSWIILASLVFTYSSIGYWLVSKLSSSVRLTNPLVGDSAQR
jgi:hypothetical protein